jgi:hypothetical protein
MSTYARAGRVVLRHQTTPAFRQTTTPQALCTYQANEARALTLMLSVNREGFTKEQPSWFSLPCNLGGDGAQGIDIGPCGVVLLEYGAGGARNYAVADLRPGSYALPPCEFAQVSISGFHPTATPSDPMPSLDVAGTLLEGQHKHAARLTASLVGMVAGGDSYIAEIPAQARWVDVEGGAVGPIATGGTITAAKVRFRELAYHQGPPAAWFGGGRYIVRDEANGVYPDPMPVELASASRYGTGNFQVWNDAAAEAVISVKFYLEL